jgi:prohibitin 1
LPVTVDITVRYRPAYRLLGALHDQVGPNYLNVVVLPVVATQLRKVVAENSAEGLYRSNFDDIRQRMLTDSKIEMAKRYVVLDDVLIRNIVLPESISVAIQRKLQRKQADEEMTYTLEVAEKEATRKLIEAKGIEEQQRHVNNTLTDKLLEYKNIEALNALAASPNAKMIVLGNGKATPLILNGDDSGPGRK